VSISPENFYNVLQKEGVIFYTGVPDSLLKPFCFYVNDNVPEERHLIAANEGNAIAVAAGYNLGTGKIPLVYMQNSGLGNAVNPLLSLCDPDVYSIPMILLIGWRGCPGIPDEPQHIKQGKIQIALLETMGIPHCTISNDDDQFEEKLKNGVNTAHTNKMPYAILVKKGSFNEYSPRSVNKNISSLFREEALEIILSRLPSDTIIISTTGKTSREVFEIRQRNNSDHDSDFLTVGSMGHCSSIALGIAISRPSLKIICIDGDGSLIMHMGGLSTIGKIKPKNFFHILMNNEVHESVGGQSTASKNIDMQALAKANGYEKLFFAEDTNSLKNQFNNLILQNGPSFLEIKVEPGSRDDLGRPSLSPAENKELFVRSLRKENP